MSEHLNKGEEITGKQTGHVTEWLRSRSGGVPPNFFRFIVEEDKHATTNVQHRFVLFFLLSFLLFCSY